MPLNRTTDLPDTDPAYARSTFARLVRDEPFVLFVVFDQDAEAQDLVRRADQVAGGTKDLRHVVWMRNPAIHDDQLAELKEHGRLDGPRVAAFCTNYDDVVCDVIRKSELPVQYSRIMRAFIRGES